MWFGATTQHFQDSSLLSHSAFWIYKKPLVFSLQIQTWGILTAQGVAILLLFKLFLSRSLYWEVSSLSATTLPLRLDSGYGSTLHNSEKRTIGIHKHIAINWGTNVTLQGLIYQSCRLDAGHCRLASSISLVSVCRRDCQLAGINFRLVLIRDSYHKLQYFSKCPAFLVLVNSLNPGVSVVCLAWPSGWEYSSERLVADWRFDSWAVVIFKLVFMSLVVVLIGQFCRDVIGRQDFQVAVTGRRQPF